MTYYTTYKIYQFHDFSGYLVPSTTSGHSLLSVRHSASVNPWIDPDIHTHLTSEEFYLLLQGELLLYIDGRIYSLQPNEMLAVRPGISHSIVGGKGLIEHFGFRAPAVVDRQVVVGAQSAPTNLVGEIPRELAMPWGFRISIKEAQNFNCWLIGLGEARYQSANFLFAFLDFPTREEANAGIGSRLRLHFHARSWEYYVCLKGSMTLQIKDEQVELHPGYMVEVYPEAKHNVIAREAPYVGMTFRVPLLTDKVEY